MGTLACNLVLYRPDPDMLAANFRFWHVEALIDQADALINRCLEDFKDYSSLDYAWNLFLADLEAEESRLGLYQGTAEREVIDRDVVKAMEEENLSGGSLLAADESEILTLVERVEEEQARQEPEHPRPIKSSLHLRVEAVQRKRELSAPGRPFALYARRDLALKRLCRDYEEAVNRACVAEEGLKKLYDQTGLSSPLPCEAETLGTSITNLALWVRNAAEWLIEYRQQEQAFTRVVSIRSLMNRNSWALLKHSRDSYALKLQIPVELFRGHYNCHLRGISAALIGEAGTVPWSIILRLPDDAIYERSGRSFEVDQRERATCLLGRVENRRSARGPEIGGASTLLNASPIGRANAAGLWSLEIIKPVGATSESFSHLEDVVLEIDLVGIPQKITG